MSLISKVLAVFLYIFGQLCFALVCFYLLFGLAVFLFAGSGRRERKPEKQRLRDEHDRQQKSLRKKLSDLSIATTSIIRSLPVSLAAANCALNKAETEFSDGAFSPFWNEVEVAIRHLAEYDAGIRQIAENTVSFAGTAKALESKAPAFIPSDAVVPDSTTAIDRMRELVRKAHKNPTFAIIYEQRRTNGILVAGFANLGAALDDLGTRIHGSIAALEQTLDSALSSLAETNAEQSRELITSIDTMRTQLATDTESRREHEGKKLEMLDNIQRRRRPLHAKFGDGQY